MCVSHTLAQNIFFLCLCNLFLPDIEIIPPQPNLMHFFLANPAAAMPSSCNWPTSVASAAAAAAVAATSIVPAAPAAAIPPCWPS